MKRYQTIVVGAALDDRDAGTLEHAAWFARTASSQTVHVAHVARTMDPPEATAKAGTALPRADEIEQRLQALIAAQKHLFPAATAVHGVARHGSLISELLKLTAQTSADLLCLGAGRHKNMNCSAMSPRVWSARRPVRCSSCRPRARRSAGVC